MQKNINDSSNSKLAAANRRRIDAEKAALKARERNNLDRQQTALRRQKEFTEKTHIWNEQILPKWGDVSQSAKVRELCSKGIPPNIRGKVWPLLIGNDLQVDEKLFEDLNRKVLMIYGNKVASMRKSKESDEDNDEDSERMHKDATYKVYKDSFSDDEAMSPAGGSGFDALSAAETAARAISKDIPIPLLHQQRLAQQLKKDKQHQTHLDITEESWFQNERNGSLDSETFELIQKQLFKRAGDVHDDTYADETDSAGDAGGAMENYLDQYEPHHDASSPPGSLQARHPGIAAITGTESVDSHCTLESYRVIGSYVDHARTQGARSASIAIAVARRAEELLSSGASLGAEPLTNSTTGSYALSDDLNEMSFALATGGDSKSISGSLLSEPFSPTSQSNDETGSRGLRITTSDNSMNAINSTEVSPRDLRTERTYVSESLMAGRYEEPVTPPPRRRHSNEYLIEAGLIQDDEGSRLRDTLPALTIEPTGPDSPSRPVGICTPLKTIQPFPAAATSSARDSPVAGRPPRRTTAGGSSLTIRNMQFPAVATMLESSDDQSAKSESVSSESVNRSEVAEPENQSSVSTRDLEATHTAEPRRRTSVSALTAQLQILEDHELQEQREQERLAAEKSAALLRRKSSEERLSGGRKTSGSSLKSRSTDELLAGSNTKLLNTMSLIEWDLPRTFPTLGFFHDGGPMHTGLERILLCYACFRPDIGYVQGMSFLVATLLLYMDEFEAFKCLANLLGRRVNMDFYRLKKEAIDSYVMCFDHFFKKSLPLLYEHMRSEGVTSEMYLMDWNMALFTKALPLEVAAQVWDMYLFEGEMYIMCVGLGILKMYAPKLSTFGVEKISPFLLHLPERINPEELFLNVSQIQVSKKAYDRVRKKMTDLARIHAAEIEAQNGMRRNKSAGHLPSHHGEDHEGETRSNLGNSLKKAIRATRETFFEARDTMIGASTSPTPTSPQLHGDATETTAETNASSTTASHSGAAGQGPQAKRRGSVKKSGMECLQS